MSESDAAVVAERLPHCGELHFSFKLNDLPLVTFQHNVTATAVESGNCFMALGDQNGDVYIIRHVTLPMSGKVSCEGIIHTSIDRPFRLVLGDKAEFLAVIDERGRVHIYKRDIENWSKDWIREKVYDKGLFGGLNGIATMLSVHFQGKENLAFLHGGKNVSCLQRYKFLFRKGYYWAVRKRA